MKRQHFIFALALFVLITSGCGSSGKKEEGRQGEGFGAESNNPPPPTGSGAEGGGTKNHAPTPIDEKARTAEIAEGYRNLSEAIKSQNDETIRKNAVQILGKNPQDTKALNALGLQAYRKGKWSLAKVYFSKAIALNPNQSEVHNNMGLVLLAEGEERDAFRSFHRAIELNPADVSATSNLGSLYVVKRDFKRALLPLEVAYQKGARDARVLNNYAIALVASGQAAKAKGLYEDVLEKNGNSKEALTNYAILLIDHMNDNKAGLDIINKLRFLGVSPESRLRINALENKAKMGLK